MVIMVRKKLSEDCEVIENVFSLLKEILYMWKVNRHLMQSL